MKTKELIEQLQLLDRSGSMQVKVNGQDIISLLAREVTTIGSKKDVTYTERTVDITALQPQISQPVIIPYPTQPINPGYPQPWVTYSSNKITLPEDQIILGNADKVPAWVHDLKSNQEMQGLTTATIRDFEKRNGKN